MKTVRFAWSKVEGSLRGPFRPGEETRERIFEVAQGDSGTLRFGRLEAGPAWPEGLARLDRFAAAPEPAPGAKNATAHNDAVLCFVEESHERSVLCTRGVDGAVAWSVDPRAWIRALLGEDYVRGWKRPLPSRIPFWNYSRAPFAAKRLLARLQDPSREAPPPPIPFPELPLDDLVDSLRRLCASLAWGSAAIDRDLWPEGARAAVTVTHDVDTGWILDAERSSVLERILDTESRLGFRGAWYVVADQLDPLRHEPALRRIREAGHELGAHGWNHDGRLEYLRPEEQVARLEKVRQRFAGLDLHGLRTPWYARSHSLFAAMEDRFAYGTSVPNTSGFFSKHTRSGCCSVFPYEPRPRLVELPMTLPPDTSVSLGRRRDVIGTIAAAIVERGGVVVTTLHPQPHQSGNEAGLDSYFGLLRDLRERFDGDLWCATPMTIVERCRRWL